MDLELHNSQLRENNNLSNCYRDTYDKKIHQGRLPFNDQTTNYEEHVSQSNTKNINLYQFNLRLPQSRQIETIQIVKQNDDKNSTSLNEVSNLCKICYEKGNPENPVINPCLCEGSMKYIHETCLKKWIEGNFHIKRKAICEICKHKYKIKLIYLYDYRCKNACQMLKNYAIVTIVTSVICCLVLSILFLIFNSIFNLDTQWKTKFMYILMLIGFISLIIVNWAFFYRCRSRYFDRSLKSWRIYNYGS